MERPPNETQFSRVVVAVEDRHEGWPWPLGRGVRAVTAHFFGTNEGSGIGSTLNG